MAGPLKNTFFAASLRDLWEASARGPQRAKVIDMDWKTRTMAPERAKNRMMKTRKVCFLPLQHSYNLAGDVRVSFLSKKENEFYPPSKKTLYSKPYLNCPYIQNAKCVLSYCPIHIFHKLLFALGCPHSSDNSNIAKQIPKRSKNLNCKFIVYMV